MNQLPALQVVVPLLSAPLCIIIRRAAWARVFASVICVLAFAIACGLHSQVTTIGPLAYHIGGWEPPWGIELRVDALTVLILLVVTSIAAVVLLSGIGERSHSIEPGQEAYFYAAFMLCLTGLIGMTLTADAFNVFVFLEISSLSTYTLIALGKGRRALTAALSYLMVGTVGGTFILLGIGLMYQLTGSLNMADLAQLLPAHTESRTLGVAFVFLLLGIALKLAVFPLYQWLPNAYAFAPSAVSAFVAGTATKVIYYLLIRFTFSVFGVGIAFGLFGLKQVLVPLSLLAMFGGSIAAIYQKDLKRLLAYSSVAQLGYLTLAFSLGTKLGVQAGLIHVVHHAVMKSGLFLVAAALMAHVGSTRLKDLEGLSRELPLTMAAFVVGGLGLIGVPGTAGFISKWYLVLAALEADELGIAAAILVSSLLAVVYVWRIIEIVYFKKSTAPSHDRSERPEVLLPAWALMLASIYFGFFTELPVGLSERAATQLTSATPVAHVFGSGFKHAAGHAPGSQPADGAHDSDEAERHAPAGDEHQ